jgi:arylsulfatase A-like enzyme
VETYAIEDCRGFSRPATTNTPIFETRDEGHPNPAWHLVRQRVALGQRLALGAALGLWAGDAALLAMSRAGARWGQWAMGMGAAALVVLSTAFVLGSVLGPLVTPAMQPLALAASSFWVALRRRQPEAQIALVAHVLAAPVLIVAWCGLAYEATLAIDAEFARAETMSAALAVVDLALAGLLFVAWGPAIRGGRALVMAAARAPVARRLLERAWLVALLVLTASAALVVALALPHRSELAALPWHDAVPLGAMVCGLLCAGALPLVPRWVRRATFAFAVFVVAWGIVGGVAMRRESSVAQGLAFHRAMSGRAGYAAWTYALDFDRDGQIGVLGGGDCAPFDRTRYTGAPEVPGNGIDEDCDGVDLSPQSLAPRPPLAIIPGSIPFRPTVILVTIDALAAPRLSALGSPDPVMPRLDDLATRSMLFGRCFSQGPSTRLSFPSMFTSRYDSQQWFEFSRRTPFSFSDNERTLADAFGDIAYETVAVIPTGYFSRSRWESVTKGFQKVDTTALSSLSGKHNAREVTDAALRILAEPRTRPLFLWVHYFDAHPPYGVPPGSSPRDGDDATLYVEELRYVDQQLGRLIDAVDGLASPAFLVLTSDHATSFHPVPASRKFHYGYDLYTSTLHVPLLFHGPELKTGRVDEIVSTMDVAPTIANLLNLDTRDRFEGTSLAPELLAGQTDPDRAIFHEYFLPEDGFRGVRDPLELVSVRTNHYNLILDRARGTYELFEWPGDYYEQHDLYEERAGSADVVHLRSLLGAFLVSAQRPTGPPPAVKATPAKGVWKPRHVHAPGVLTAPSAGK